MSYTDARKQVKSNEIEAREHVIQYIGTGLDQDGEVLTALVNAVPKTKLIDVLAEIYRRREGK